jgi:hypothetical protein
MKQTRSLFASVAVEAGHVSTPQPLVEHVLCSEYFGQPSHVSGRDGLGPLRLRELAIPARRKLVEGNASMSPVFFRAACIALKPRRANETER